MTPGNPEIKPEGNPLTGNPIGNPEGNPLTGNPPGAKPANHASAAGFPSDSGQGSPPAQAAGQAFPEPKVIEAVVDPKQKVKEGPAVFSFTNPKAVQEQYAAPSKGDAEKKEIDTRSDAEKLAALDAEIANDEKSGQQRAYSDYHDTAEMFILGYEATLMFIGRLISKDTSDTAYGFNEKTRERLIYQATKVSRKRNWVMPIEYMFAGTILPATAGVLLKAKEKRNEYLKNNPKDKEPEFNKGGKNKGMEKKRGPGRPKI